MKHKQFAADEASVKIDANGAGTARIAFAKFNEVDKDGDVTLPGAFKEGQEVRVSYWGHRWSDLPVGKGIISQDDQWAYADIKFFLDTDHGRNTYETVKGLGALQEWSYGFNVLDGEKHGTFNGGQVPGSILKSLDTFEVSPVLLGAGNDTHTVAIKAAGEGVTGVHECPGCGLGLNITINSAADPDGTASEDGGKTAPAELGNTKNDDQLQDASDLLLHYEATKARQLGVDI